MSDTVALIEEVERSFDVNFADDELERVGTAGELFDAITHKLGPESQNLCMTQHVFYRLRRALTKTHGPACAKTGPRVRASEVFGERVRKDDWSLFCASLGLRLPDLELPGWLHKLISIPFVLLFYGGILAVFFTGYWGILACVAAAAYYGVACYVTEPFRTCLPEDSSTLGDLARAILWRNFGEIRSEMNGWSRRDAWESLQSIFEAELDVERDRVRPEARLVQDLGVAD